MKNVKFIWGNFIDFASTVYIFFLLSVCMVFHFFLMSYWSYYYWIWGWMDLEFPRAYEIVFGISILSRHLLFQTNRLYGNLSGPVFCGIWRHRIGKRLRDSFVRPLWLMDLPATVPGSDGFGFDRTFTGLLRPYSVPGIYGGSTGARSYDAGGCPLFGGRRRLPYPSATISGHTTVTSTVLIRHFRLDLVTVVTSSSV